MLCVVFNECDYRKRKAILHIKYCLKTNMNNNTAVITTLLRIVIFEIIKKCYTKFKYSHLFHSEYNVKLMCFRYNKPNMNNSKKKYPKNIFIFTQTHTKTRQSIKSNKKCFKYIFFSDMICVVTAEAPTNTCTVNTTNKIANQ